MQRPFYCHNRLIALFRKYLQSVWEWRKFISCGAWWRHRRNWLRCGCVVFRKVAPAFGNRRGLGPTFSAMLLPGRYSDEEESSILKQVGRTSPRPGWPLTTRLAWVVGGTGSYLDRLKGFEGLRFVSTAWKRTSSLIFDVLLFWHYNVTVDGIWSGRFRGFVEKFGDEDKERKWFAPLLYFIVWAKFFRVSRTLSSLKDQALSNPLSTGFLQAFEESADWTLLSSFCDDSNSHISAFEATGLYQGDSIWISPEQNFSVWGHFDHDISPHKQTIAFVYLNDDIGRRNVTLAGVIPTPFWGVMIAIKSGLSLWVWSIFI